MLPNKNLVERILHAVCFEALALLICVPALTLLMDQPPLTMGLLTLAISLTATLWNMTYNTLFDRLQKRLGFKRTLWVRVWHTLGFEAGLMAVVLPMAAWWLSITLLEAFAMEVGLLLFFLPYAYVYNLVYDRLREAGWLRRRRMAA
ncbi:Bacterial Transmembrane Pair family protein [Amantichitinum ursilacus]|uniref:Bacterial Transmembrane Pair family protein n=2 Tax=Amantichitinum ursilacus TaxID=857265 RepID=A0A0N1JSL1_9NEIS|nr:Bacterial Transmembrane Pair family protein [Amantichitinum ursilacus]